MRVVDRKQEIYLERPNQGGNAYKTSDGGFSWFNVYITLFH